MVSRGGKIALWVTVPIAGVIVLLVLAVIGWMLFRPLMPGDWGKAQRLTDSLEEYNDFPLEAMAATVGTPASGDSSENLGNRIANTLGQLENSQEVVDELADSRAAQGDEEFGALVADLDDAYQALGDRFSAWEEDGYAAAASLAVGCTGLRDIVGCDPSLADEVTGEIPEIRAMAEAGLAEDPVAAETALAAVKESYEEVWADIVDSLEATSEYAASQN